MDRLRTLIMGAAGRDFHNFNVVYRDDVRYEVVGFTAAQIPNIAGRRYPRELAGPLYPEGIPIFDEGELASIRDIVEMSQSHRCYTRIDVSTSGAGQRRLVTAGPAAD